MRFRGLQLWGINVGGAEIGGSELSLRNFRKRLCALQVGLLGDFQRASEGVHDPFGRALSKVCRENMHYRALLFSQDRDYGRAIELLKNDRVAEAIFEAMPPIGSTAISHIDEPTSHLDEKR